MMRALLSTAVAAGALTWAGARAVGSRGEAARAAAELRAVAAETEELRALRDAVPPDARPGVGLAGRVAAALSRCGLGTATLSSLSPESAVSAGEGLERQRATLVLAGLTLPQLGAFLDDWRRAEPAWAVASLDLSPAPPETPGADLPLRCVIGLEAVYTKRIGGPP